MKIIVIFIVLLLSKVNSLDNGLALTPQMAWNSWNKFGCGINEDLIKQTADAIVSSGLAAKGYEYVNLDDCWQISRDPITGVIQPDPKAFPNGMKPLVDYVHSKGLKFGLYSDAGNKTCQGRPGSLGYEKIDADTYASWGVDYLKYDNCYNDDIPPKTRYPVMTNALNQTGRKIFFSMCEWGQDQPWLWAMPVGNSWRTTGDISDNFDSMVSNLEQQVGLNAYSGKGGWNDPDMLEVGNGGMTNDEYQSHFALWSLLKAPLIVGCDVRSMSQETLDILSNEEIIAVNQDSLGVQGNRISSVNGNEVWSGPLANGEQVVVLFNKNGSPQNISFSFADVNFKSESNGQAFLRDLINQKDLGTFQDSFTGEVAIHGSIMVRMSQPSLKTKAQSLFKKFLGFFDKIIH